MKLMFLHKPCWEEDILSVFDNIFMFVPIDILSGGGVCPLIAELHHPTSGGGEGDWDCGPILDLRIVLIEVLDKIFCLDVLANTLKVHLKFFVEAIFCVKMADIPRTLCIHWERLWVQYE